MNPDQPPYEDGLRPSLPAWCRMRDSNPQLLPCKGSTLPVELILHMTDKNRFGLPVRNNSFILICFSVPNSCSHSFPKDNSHDRIRTCDPLVNSQLLYLLSYMRWWSLWDSNPGLSGYEPDALITELRLQNGTDGTRTHNRLLAKQLRSH